MLLSGHLSLPVPQRHKWVWLEADSPNIYGNTVTKFIQHYHVCAVKDQEVKQKEKHLEFGIAGSGVRL